VYFERDSLVFAKQENTLWLLRSQEKFSRFLWNVSFDAQCCAVSKRWGPSCDITCIKTWSISF